MYKTIAAAHPGMYHLSSSLPCQDAVYRYTGEEGAVITLADGAGSVPESGTISRAFTETAGDYLLQHFERLYELPAEAVKDEIAGLASAVSAQCGMPADCTFLAYVRKDCRSLMLHIGDGMIFGIGESAAVLSLPENGRYHNETFFLSDPHVHERLRVRKDPEGIDTVILCSDGISPQLWNARSGQIANAVSIFAGWLRNYPAEQVEQRVREEIKDLFSTMSDDDMSIAMMHWDDGTSDGQAVCR